jgi:hypothetical protein
MEIIGEGGKDGAREKFERLIAQLVRLQFRTAKRVEANPGDWGLNPRELRFGGEAAHAGDLADQLGGGQHVTSVLGQQLWRQVSHQRREVTLEFADRARELADSTQLVASDPHSCGLIAAREAPGDAFLPGVVDHSARRDLMFGPEVVQLPAADR